MLGDRVSESCARVIVSERLPVPTNRYPLFIQGLKSVTATNGRDVSIDGNFGCPLPARVGPSAPTLNHVDRRPHTRRKVLNTHGSRVGLRSRVSTHFRPAGATASRRGSESAIKRLIHHGTVPGRRTATLRPSCGTATGRSGRPSQPSEPPPRRHLGEESVTAGPPQSGGNCTADGDCGSPLSVRVGTSAPVLDYFDRRPHTAVKYEICHDSRLSFITR